MANETVSSDVVEKTGAVEKTDVVENVVKNVADDSLESKILKQVEYYFSDYNLPTDKFMLAELERNDGWLPLDVLLKFGRLKSLTTDKSVVSGAIAQSEILEMSPCGEKLRRSQPLSAAEENQLNEKTVHLHGFPLDVTFDDLHKFCSDFGPVGSLKMRRHFKSKMFKGCIHVTFENLADAEKVLAVDDLAFKGNALRKENFVNYYVRKNMYLESLKNKKSSNSSVKPSIEIKPNSLVKISGLEPGTGHMKIKDELSKSTNVAYVSDIDSSSQCFVRLANGGAKELIESFKERGVSEEGENGAETVKCEFLGKSCTFTIPTQSEEGTFCDNFKKSLNASKGSKKGIGKYKSRAAKRSRFNEDGDNQSKKKKDE